MTLPSSYPTPFPAETVRVAPAHVRQRCLELQPDLFDNPDLWTVYVEHVLLVRPVGDFETWAHRSEELSRSVSEALIKGCLPSAAAGLPEAESFYGPQIENWERRGGYQARYLGCEGRLYQGQTASLLSGMPAAYQWPEEQLLLRLTHYTLSPSTR